ncbi:ATP-binding cassette domain-containing protein [Promethearchaeum syntrophicum]|uniref:ATP-binding cassette domain-containing protein n=1 Tax=Promethearchaeum syntrophicum TaxID=2594042 RepID=A0A5B9DDH5_9ARCH|nr:ATP-binding cassette domain-containing protein [Candidatus Prometheoarchaeum syntrophicum]QEE16766.1 putative ABC transporter ATP-binding protein [Candidatus Prometheoarchaeum syntrophicum]
MTEQNVKADQMNNSSFEGSENILLEAKGLYAIYHGLEGAENVVALRGLDIMIQQREFVSVVGTSGAGKSTLLRILGGLQRPSAGSLRYFGQDITNVSEDLLVPFRRNTIGFIFQEGNLLAEHSAYENVLKTLRYAGVSYSASVKRTKEVLHQLGMTSRMHARPQKLSGGELQRVAIARALANKPLLILADEPTGNLDHENTDQVMGLLKDLHNEMNTSILIVTHSPHVASYSDRNIELSDGKIVGHHDAGSNIYALEKSRSVIISETGNMTLPPEVMSAIEPYGNMWNFRFELLNDNPRIIATPKSTSSGICPICNTPVEINSSFCTNCGARLQR